MQINNPSLNIPQSLIRSNAVMSLVIVSPKIGCLAQYSSFVYIIQIRMNVMLEDLVQRAMVMNDDPSYHRKTVNEFAAKFSIKELCIMYSNPNHIPKMFQKIIQAKLNRGLVIPEEYRIQVYKILGLVNYHKQNSPVFYQQLLGMHSYPNYFESTIEKDVLRTTPSVDQGQVAKERFHAKLRNILLALCRRNPHIGYCQGFNYMVAFFLELRMDEEDVFHIVSHLIESIVPPDYYNSMTGVLCDDKLLDILMSLRLPQLRQQIYDMGVQTSVFSIQWLVCLFTFFGINKKVTNLHHNQTVVIIMDCLLAFGSDTLVQACMTHLDLAEQELSNHRDLGPFLQCLESRLRTNGNSSEFLARMMHYRMDRKLLDQARDMIRHKIIEDKLASDVKFLPKKVLQASQLLTVRCNPKFPICLFVKEKSKIDKEYFDQLVFRTAHFEVYEHYMDDLQHHEPHDQDLVIGRDHHLCPQFGLKRVDSDPDVKGEWHVSIGDIKYAQYLNINDRIDYARQSYIQIPVKPQPSTPKAEKAKEKKPHRNRSPLMEFLLYPIKLLDPSNGKPQPQMPSMKEQVPVSPRPLNIKHTAWKPKPYTTTRQRIKNKRAYSPSFNSTQMQSSSESNQHEQFEKLQEPIKEHIKEPYDETQNLKKLSFMIGHDEASLMHSSSVRFLADIIFGNDQLQNIFTRPHSPTSIQISRQGSIVHH